MNAAPYEVQITHNALRCQKGIVSSSNDTLSDVLDRRMRDDSILTDYKPVFIFIFFPPEYAVLSVSNALLKQNFKLSSEIVPDSSNRPKNEK